MRAAPASDDEVVFDDFELALEVNDDSKFDFCNYFVKPGEKEAKGAKGESEQKIATFCLLQVTMSSKRVNPQLNVMIKIEIISVSMKIVIISIIMVTKWKKVETTSTSVSKHKYKHRPNHFQSELEKV